MINLSLKKEFAKYGAETIPRPFSKKSIWNITLDQQSQVSKSLFLNFEINLIFLIKLFSYMTKKL